MSIVKASFTVRLTGNENATGQLSMEVDSRPNGKNKGKTQFKPGDPVFFLIYVSPNVQNLTVIATAGQVSRADSASVELTDVLTFDNISGTEATLSKPAESITSKDWQGASLGNATLLDDKTTLKLPDSIKLEPADGETKAAYEKRQAAMLQIGVLKVVYTASAQVWKLQTPTEINGETEFDITVAAGGYYADNG